MKRTIDLININSKKGFPRIYRFNQFMRWFTILLAILAISYAVWFILSAVDAETSTFKKIIPFIIIFLASNSLFRNFFSLNKLLFKEDNIEFCYILSKNIAIKWEEITKISIYEGKTRAVVLEYERDNAKKKLIFTMVFPNMLEIINSIAEMCPKLECDDFMKTVIISRPDHTQ